jgi:hypothetical protein
MNIYWLRPFWFGQRTFTDTSIHKDYFTITFENRPNIDAQVWLTVLSSGATFSGGAVTALGLAAAAFKSYRFINARGESEFKELDRGRRTSASKIVELTVAFLLAWAKAEG